MEKNLKKNTCIKLNNFAIHLKLTQHCRSTILQFKKKERNTLLNNQEITEEIKEEIKKYLETNDNENKIGRAHV